MANIKSQLKRIKTNEKARQRNKADKSSLKTAVRRFRDAADAHNPEAATLAMTERIIATCGGDAARPVPLLPAYSSTLRLSAAGRSFASQPIVVSLSWVPVYATLRGT